MENIKHMNLIIRLYSLSLLVKLKRKLIRHQHVTNIKFRSHLNIRNRLVLTVFNGLEIQKKNLHI